MTVWQVEDMVGNAAKAQRDELLWLIAASPLAAKDVIARHEELERVGRKEQGMDALMERLAAEKRARAVSN